MEVRSEGSGRARAWILVQADSPESAAREIYETIGQEDGDRYVLVRADIVDYAYNIVVPVDAENWDVLHGVRRRIQELEGVMETAFVPVMEHVPYPPHLADGYIAEDEVGDYTGPEEIKIGRQRNSPGWNPWG
ncbi:MAG: hypothetical protein ACP5JJ_17965 [Anaerolineae bacterium]